MLSIGDFTRTGQTMKMSHMHNFINLAVAYCTENDKTYIPLESRIARDELPQMQRENLSNFACDMDVLSTRSSILAKKVAVSKLTWGLPTSSTRKSRETTKRHAAAEFAGASI